MSDGSLRFDQYQDHCLYDAERGFYAVRGNAGRRCGDFITSPEVGPLFGRVIARALAAWWTEAGEPEEFVVAEAAAGRGALAASILSAAEFPIRYVCVERSERLRHEAHQLLGDRAEVAAVLPERAHVIIANELLDNLAVRIIERTATGWSEVYVPDELRDTELELDVVVAIGTRLPVFEQARDWVRQACDAAERVIAFDYGVLNTAELATRDWLRTYAEHTRGTDPFALEPGSADITCDVAVDQLPAPTSVCTQAEFLRRWGIDELVEEGRRIWTERAHIGDLQAIKARSRVREAEALCEAGGLGDFLVMDWHPPPTCPADLQKSAGCWASW